MYDSANICQVQEIYILDQPKALVLPHEQHGLAPHAALSSHMPLTCIALLHRVCIHGTLAIHNRRQHQALLATSPATTTHDLVECLASATPAKHADAGQPYLPA